MGYMDSFHKQGYRLTLKPGDYPTLDTRVLENLILRDTLGMTDDDIDHKRGLDYSKDTPDAVEAVRQRPRRRRLLHARHPGRAGARDGGRRRVDAAEVDLLLPQDPDGLGL